MDTAFFEGLNPQPVTLPSGYQGNLPARYYDFRFICAFFPVSTARVQAWLPSRKLKPVQVWPGTAMLSISGVEYRQIDCLKPYNEFMIGPLVQYEPRRDWPGLVLLREPLTAPQWYTRPGTYLQWMPVTTEAAREAGVVLFGYPKVVTDILVEDIGANVRARLYMGGVDVLTLQVKKRAVRPITFTLYSYTKKDDLLLRTRIPTQGQMAYRKWPGGASCTLGRGIIADELRAAGLGRTALGSIYSPQTQCILHNAEERLSL